MLKKLSIKAIKLICIIISIQSQVYAMHKPDEEAECHQILLNLKSIAKEVLYANTNKSLSKKTVIIY